MALGRYFSIRCGTTPVVWLVVQIVNHARATRSVAWRGNMVFEFCSHYKAVFRNLSYHFFW